MNIFYLDKDPKVCAEMHLDKHVVKMIIEYAQLMSTAHRVLDGQPYIDKTANGRSIKRWRLSDGLENVLMKASLIIRLVCGLGQAMKTTIGFIACGIICVKSTPIVMAKHTRLKHDYLMHFIFRPKKYPLVFFFRLRLRCLMIVKYQIIHLRPTTNTI